MNNILLNNNNFIGTTHNDTSKSTSKSTSNFIIGTSNILEQHSSNYTNITSNTLYDVSSINITHGVWSLFGQVSYKCNSITGSNPLISYNVFGIGLSTTGYGNYRVESYSTQSNFNVNSTFSDQVVRINTITTNSTLYLNHCINFQDCTLSTNSVQSFLVATRIA